MGLKVPGNLLVIAGEGEVQHLQLADQRFDGQTQGLNQSRIFGQGPGLADLLKPLVDDRRSPATVLLIKTTQLAGPRLLASLRLGALSEIS